MLKNSNRLVPFVIVMFAASLSFAATWYERFVSNYEDKGIDKAVEIALKEDEQKPYMIIKTALPIEDLKREVLIKALFCAGAKPDEVQSAAAQNELTDQVVYDGYQLAITECRRQLVEWYNFIPPGDTPPDRPASPWNFNK